MRGTEGVEQAADWDAVWLTEIDDEDLDAEERTLRWRAQAELVTPLFGSFEGLRVAEIGAGRATNALLYARHGARATVIDMSAIALEQSRRRFDSAGLELETIEADVFDLPADALGRFDVAMSFGLCEHFLGERRRRVIGAHLDLVRPGGLALINVPNRWSPFYRAWMGLAKRRGTWTLGTEVPFTGREVRDLAALSGGVPLTPRYCGGLGTLVNHGLNNALQRLGARPLPVPQVKVPGLDYLAYDLLVPVAKP